jgi:hypothetical protein
MSAVPAETPVTSPDTLTVATAVLEEVQGLVEADIPDPDSVVIEPAQTDKVPLMVGNEFTVISLDVFEHPVAVSVKVKVTVPTAIPVTTPSSVTVANKLSLLDHVPPVEGVSVMVDPTQTELADEEITGGSQSAKAKAALVRFVQPLKEAAGPGGWK